MSCAAWSKGDVMIKNNNKKNLPAFAGIFVSADFSGHGRYPLGVHEPFHVKTSVTHRLGDASNDAGAIARSTP